MLRVNLCLALAAAALLAAPAFAQNRATTAEIVGLLEDSTGGVLPGVTVTVVNLDDGLVRSAVSDGGGRYAVMLLPPGRYDVRYNGSTNRALNSDGVGSVITPTTHRSLETNGAEEDSTQTVVGQFNPTPAADNDVLRDQLRGVTFPIGRTVDPTAIPSSGRQFGPRAGFAWDPTGAAKTVVRGFAGIYYARTPLLLMAGPVNNFRVPPGDLTAEYGPSALDRRHQFHLHAVFALPGAIDLSTGMYALSGAPFDARMGTDSNKDRGGADRPYNAPACRSPATRFATSQSPMSTCGCRSGSRSAAAARRSCRWSSSTCSTWTT